MSIPPMESSNPTTTVKRDIAWLKRRVAEVASSIQRFERVTIGNGGIKITEGGMLEAVGGLIRSRFIFLRGELWPAFVGFYNEQAGTEHRVGDLDGTEVGVYSSWGPVALRSATKDVRIDHVPSAGTANVIINATTGTITRTGSSLRYKQDVEDAVIDLDDVRALRPRTWRDRWQVSQDPDTEVRWPGYIAEELDELPTMRQFVIYDDLGPESIAFDKLTMPVLLLAQDTDKRVTELEQALAEQAETVATLTARLDARDGGAGQ